MFRILSILVAACVATSAWAVEVGEREVGRHAVLQCRAAIGGRGADGDDAGLGIDHRRSAHSSGRRHE